MGCQRVYLVAAIYPSTVKQTAFDNEARVCINQCYTYLLLVYHNLVLTGDKEWSPTVGARSPWSSEVSSYPVCHGPDIVHTVTSVWWESCHSHTPKWWSGSCRSCNHLVQIHWMFRMTNLVSWNHASCICPCMRLRAPYITNKWRSHVRHWRWATHEHLVRVRCCDDGCSTTHVEQYGSTF